MNRREFLSKSALMAALIGVSVKVTSCGSDDPAAPGTGNGNVTGSTTDGGDHSHTGTITKAQLDAGNAVNITFSGGGHTHSLPLTNTEVTNIAMGTRVQKDFTDFQHPHTYTFN